MDGWDYIQLAEFERAEKSLVAQSLTFYTTHKVINSLRSLVGYKIANENPDFPHWTRRRHRREKTKTQRETKMACRREQSKGAC